MENSFVSRGGEKLAFALKIFKIDVKGKICADFGCSTGGFTDCLLKNGAKRVYSVDTAYGTLDWDLRRNSKVFVYEKTNALHVVLPEKVDLICIDTSWTKQEFILPSAVRNLKKNGEIISLVKPHYEAERKYLEKGKVLERFLPLVLSQVKKKIKALNLIVAGETKSPITGRKGGNIEYLFWLKIK